MVIGVIPINEPTIVEAIAFFNDWTIAMGVAGEYSCASPICVADVNQRGTTLAYLEQ